MKSISGSTGRFHADSSGKSRDGYVDFLRGFGLLLLILAHTSPPSGLLQARCFDVPLMVFVSASCFRMPDGRYIDYFVKRFKRIYYPLGLFLVVFFAGSAFCRLIWGVPVFSIGRIVGSFLLFEPSIEFIWIMRVFLLIALVAPLLAKATSELKGWSVIAVIFAVVALQEILCLGVELIRVDWLGRAIRLYVLTTIGYTPFFILGLTVRRLSRSQLGVTALLSVIAVGLMVGACNGHFHPQQFKYPPQSLFIFYGLFATGLLYLIKPYVAGAVSGHAFMGYLSRNSMWIYLWHIVPAYVLLTLGLRLNWVVVYMILLGGGLAFTWIYSKLRDVVRWLPA